MGTSRSVLVGGLLLAVAGCPAAAPDDVGALVQEVFVRPADDGSGQLVGYLRWAWLSEPPSSDGELDVACTLWEELSASPIEAPGFCEACVEAWWVDALPDDDDCGGLAWSPRSFTLGLAPLEHGPDLLSGHAEDGFVYAVWSTSSPDAGAGTWQPLFAAQPWIWSGVEGARSGVAGEGFSSGEWALWSPYYWEVSGLSSTDTVSE